MVNLSILTRFILDRQAFSFNNIEPQLAISNNVSF